MYRIWISLLALGSILIGMGREAVLAKEGSWPEGYEIREGSTSPDGRYGVLLPTREQAGEDEEDSIANVLVNLKTYARLGVIHGTHYFPGENHRGLRVVWAEDSTWCVVVYEGRYGFDTITAVEPRGTTCTQHDLGQHVQKALDAVIARQSGEKDASASASSVYFRSAPGRKILVRSTAQTNPKSFPDVHTWYAFFQGTFDLTGKKWVNSDARKIDAEEENALDTAFYDFEAEHATFSSEDERLKSLDDRLNEVYRAARLILPGERFADLKKKQIAWVKRLEATESTAAKSKLIETRIRELQAIVWDR